MEFRYFLLEIRSGLRGAASIAYIVPNYTACYDSQVVSGPKHNAILVKSSMTNTTTLNHVHGS